MFSYFGGKAFSFTHAVVATRMFDIMCKPLKYTFCIKISIEIKKVMATKTIYVNLDNDIIYTLYQMNSRLKDISTIIR